jgi:hypothetical protein
MDKGVTWLMKLGGQSLPRVSGTLIYARSQIKKSGKIGFDPVRDIHTPLTPILDKIYYICLPSN